MGKKVYKMTEDQVASVLNKKKEGVLADMPAPGLKLSTEGSDKKTKYKITEDQIKRIINELGKKAVDEMDNYNYPMGSDTPDAPWNQNDDNVKQGESVGGDYVGVFTAQGEFLLKNKQTNQLLYTLTDVWYDIYAELEDYLDIPQEEDEDEDGRYMTAVSGWKDYITNDELLEALASYINDKAKRNQDLKITDTIDAWENGEHEFLVVKPETMETIGSQPVVEKAKGLLGLN
jgi:hypothetical protein